MSRRVVVLMAFALVVAACSDHNTPTSPPNVSTASAATPRAARERLAQQLARALADPAVRASIKQRLDKSNAPEGKLQFQALMHADGSLLVSSLARAAATSVPELLADLDQARGLELYLPVASQRAAWPGDDNYLVATLGADGEAPVAFDAHGARRLLDRRTPPDIPVLALVPQETDFTHGHPELSIACVDMCGDLDGAGSGGGGGGGSGGGSESAGSNGFNGSLSVNNGAAVPGLYLVQSHFNDTYESWLKGNPEFEYHVYGIGADSQSVQLACTGEQQSGGYYWDQNNLDWTGSALLLSDADLNAYQAKHPGAPVRIVAWEDDNESCVDHADADNVTSLLSAIDAAYNSITSGKVDPWYYRGIRAAPSIFTLITAAWNLIKTNDDLIGNAVETSVAGTAPDGANWVLKGDGMLTTGWFTTAHLP